MMCDDCSDVIVYGGTLALECQSLGNKLPIRDVEKVCAEYYTTVLCSVGMWRNYRNLSAIPFRLLSLEFGVLCAWKRAA